MILTIKKLIICISLLALTAILLLGYPSKANNTQVAADLAQLEELSISGTEPFWNVTVKKTVLAKLQHHVRGLQLHLDVMQLVLKLTPFSRWMDYQ